jgi:hypothetical protein
MCVRSYFLGDKATGPLPDLLIYTPPYAFMACIRTVLPLPLRKPAVISICAVLDKTFMDTFVGKIRLV